MDFCLLEDFWTKIWTGFELAGRNSQFANRFSEFANFKAQLLHIFANPYFHMLSREKVTRSQFYDSTKKTPVYNNTYFIDLLSYTLETHFFHCSVLFNTLGIIQPLHNASKGEGIDFCYGALRKLRYRELQGGRGSLKSCKTGVT